MNKSLTKTNNPKELLEWMNANLTYHGINKGKVYTPQEVLKYKKGHCWETLELAANELHAYGYEVVLLYLEAKDLSVTHTTVLYKYNNKWYWFEWAWFKYSGITELYSSLDKSINIIATKFKQTHGSLVKAKYGASIIKDNMSELDYINLINENWNDVILNKKFLLSKW